MITYRTRYVLIVCGFVERQKKQYVRFFTVCSSDSLINFFSMYIRISVLRKHQLIGEFETNIPDMRNRLSIKGNADRDRAIGLSQEYSQTVFGLLCILKADVVEDHAQP